MIWFIELVLIMALGVPLMAMLIALIVAATWLQVQEREREEPHE